MALGCPGMLDTQVQAGARLRQERGGRGIKQHTDGTHAGSVVHVHRPAPQPPPPPAAGLPPGCCRPLAVRSQHLQRVRLCVQHPAVQGQCRVRGEEQPKVLERLSQEPGLLHVVALNRHLGGGLGERGSSLKAA